MSSVASGVDSSGVASFKESVAATFFDVVRLLTVVFSSDGAFCADCFGAVLLRGFGFSATGDDELSSVKTISL